MRGVFPVKHVFEPNTGHVLAPSDQIIKVLIMSNIIQKKDVIKIIIYIITISLRAGGSDATPIAFLKLLKQNYIKQCFSRY